MSTSTNSVNSSRWIIEDKIKKGVESGRFEFRPLEIAAEANVALALAFDHMLRMARQKKLVLIWKVSCEHCGSSFTVLSGKEVYCEKCGQRFSDAFPVFVVAPDYGAYVLSEKGA